LALLVCGIDEPHDEKEGHHRSHEVGICNLPDATMMTVMIIVPTTTNDNDFAFAFRIDAHLAAALNSSRTGATRVSSTRSPKENESSPDVVSVNRHSAGRRSACFRSGSR